MGENLSDLFCEYKNCTLKIIEIIEKEDFDSIQSLVDKRQTLTEHIISMMNEKENAKQLFDELNLAELQDQLNIIISNKLSNIKTEIKILDKNKAAANLYNKSRFSNAKIFSKKI